MKIISVLGSTGSIGCQALEVVAAAAGDLRIESLTANEDVDGLEKQIRRFRPSFVAMMNEAKAKELKGRLRDVPVRIGAGMAGLLEAVTLAPVDMVVTSVSGRIGLEPTLAAIEAGKAIALANKETLVAAGGLVMKTARRKGVPILPVDSEHSAIFQVLHGAKSEVQNLILTASGGPFLDVAKEALQDITPAEALRHPKWDMGAKITIDSATMMNKALEIIEARFLFDMPYEQIRVLVHPQSLVHSLVEYQDGSVLAQLGETDMRLPIQYALSYPQRWPICFQALQLAGKTLSFIEPDLERFPALALGYSCGKTGGTMPAVLNGANEIFVHAFLKRRIKYLEIVALTEEVTKRHQVQEARTLQAVLEADLWAREEARSLLRERKGD